MCELNLRFKMISLWNWPSEDYLEFCQLDAQYRYSVRTVRQYQEWDAIENGPLWERMKAVENGNNSIFGTLRRIFQLFSKHNNHRDFPYWAEYRIALEKVRNIYTP